MAKAVQQVLVADIELPGNRIPNDTFITLSCYELWLRKLKEEQEAKNDLVLEELKKDSSDRDPQVFIDFAVADAALLCAQAQQKTYQG